LPTPRGGGLAIVVVVLVALISLCYRAIISLDVCFALSGSGIIAAMVGFWDDHRDVSVRTRILVHFLAASWILFWLGGFPGIATGITAWRVSQNLFWLIGLVWLLNVYNFMDGVDAIAGSEAIFISCGAGLLLLWGGANGLAMVAFIIAAATAGFLLWNLPPARIFLGDVGSSFLGIILGALAIVSVRQGKLSMWVWAILFGVFIVDATITVGRRMMRGAKWYSAHRSHAYQYAARIYGSHGKVTAGVIVLNVIWLFPWAAVSYKWPHLGPLFTIVAYVPLVFLSFLLNAGVDEKKIINKMSLLGTKGV